MIKLKTLLKENMRRFRTKNLNEDEDQNNNGYPDGTEGGDNEILFRDFTTGDKSFIDYQEKKLSNNETDYLFLNTYSSMEEAKADGGKDYMYLERNGKIFSFFPTGFPDSTERI
jgi:hypothetical protein